MNRSLYPMSPLSVPLPVNIFGIGFEENQSNIIRKEGFHVHQFFLCTAGEGEIVLQNKKSHVKSGDFYFIPSHLPHEYYALKEKWKVQWIAFYADEKLMETAELKDFLIFPSDKLQNLDSYYKRIFSVLKNETASGKFEASSILFEMISEIYSGMNKEKEFSENEKDTIDKAISFIDQNFCKYFTIDELSDNCGVSPQYLCRLFQKHYQMRPFQYLALKRIQRAKELLQKPSIPVSEIAKQVGYDDFSYFCSVFKKNEGISPTQFRGMC